MFFTIHPRGIEVVNLYEFIPREGQYGCKLYGNAEPDEKGQYHGFLIYAETSGGEPRPLLKKFSGKGEKSMLNTAERWIRKELFSDYDKSLVQIIDEIPSGAV